jgi:hypothetical protein
LIRHASLAVAKLARAHHAESIRHQRADEISRVEQHVVGDRNELLHDFLLADCAGSLKQATVQTP